MRTGRRNGALLAAVATDDSPTDVIATASSVWIACSGSGTVERLRLP